jgi:two-component system alkaline phosphatase synthesis response regulator PhoP
VRILLVEDDPSLVSLYKKKIESEGLIVDAALDGAEGLKKAGNKKYHLIILDLVLPKIDGLEVLKKIRQNSEIKNTPVLILTNVGISDILMEQAENLEAKEFILKYKTSLEELMRKINLVLLRPADGGASAGF